MPGAHPLDSAGAGANFPGHPSRRGVAIRISRTPRTGSYRTSKRRLPPMRVAVSLLAAAVLALPAALPQAAGASPISDARQLTFEGKRAGEGYFSADGSKMIFQSERVEGNPFFQMYLFDLETGDIERLSTGVGKTTCGWIHPGGEKALFATTQFDPRAEEKMQAELEARASGETRRYSWDYDPTYEIVETDLEEGGYTKLTDARGYDAEGAYSPDGEHIVFASNRHAYARDLSREEEQRLERQPSYFMDIYVMDSDGSDVRRLTDAPGYDGGPFWSADGEKIVWRRFAEDGKTAEVYTMDADGSDIRQITHMGVMSWAPFFHPSGEYIIFANNKHGFDNFELYIVDAEGRKQPVRITDREGFDGLPTFAPGGETISWTSNATSSGNSQLFIADWEHQEALALLAEAPLRERAAAPSVEGTSPEIAVADLKRHVEALTAEEMAGRLTGTEGARKATGYVAETFRGLGLAPAGVDGGMFQPFEFTAGVALAEGNTLSVSVDGEARDLEVKERWRPLAFSKPGTVEQTGVTFAGYGIVAPETGERPGLDSYQDVDVAGQWVLVWRGMPGELSRERRTYLSRFADPRYKASVAKANGAAGVIFAPPPRDDFPDELPRMSYEASSGSANLPVVAVDRAAMERMLSILGDELDAVAARLDEGETGARRLIGVEAAAEIALDQETRTGRNVLARLDLDGEPAGEGRPPLVIGAHVDHLGRGETAGSLAGAEGEGKIHPGADDNASGVAALIEVAQWLKAREEELEGARDVIFAAWSGEELGLLGASHFTDAKVEAANAEDLSELVSAYINMDMVGRLSDEVIAGGVASSPIWEREIERRNAVVRLPITTSADPYMPTDATAFYLKGVPILSLFTGAHGDYHRPSDTADKLNYEGLRDVARFVALVGRSRALSADEPEFVERERPGGEGGRQMGGVRLGTIPDYAEEGVTGVPLSGVAKGGPAAEAGLKGGDVVVELAGEDLENIYDYVRVINGLKPGEEVSITVRRDGEPVEMGIVPARRE
jgi:Tol biopolymer transport system component